jgi:hypothetical protein
MRGIATETIENGSELDARCAALMRSLAAIADEAEPATVSIAAAGVRESCPEADPDVTWIELESSWTEASADAIEARALSSTSARARRWGARARLRRVPTEVLLASSAGKSLPRIEDGATLAIHLAAQALALARVTPKDPAVIELVTAARSLALAEPTAARLIGEIAKTLGKPESDPWRATACALAATQIEKAACK